MKKYGILVYQYISVHAHKFDVISTPWDLVSVWPCSLPISVTDKQGQTQYQWPLTVMFKIVEDNDWGQEQTDAINSSVTAWNLANPDRLIPQSLQLIYTPEEAVNIEQIFENERQRLINLLP